MTRIFTKNKALVAFLILAAAVAVALVLIYYLPKKEGPAIAPTTSQIIKISNHPSFGDYLTDGKGMTLYVFRKDQTTEDFYRSNCENECVKVWPPYLYDDGNEFWKIPGDMHQKNLSAIKRSDGSAQYIYHNQPLYYYVGDEKPGDTNGYRVDTDWSPIRFRAGRQE